MNASRSIPIACICVLLAGCGATRPTQFYQLTVPEERAPDPAPGSVHPVTIIVGVIHASHLYREDHIVYGSSGENMGIYEYQRWVQPPTEMIQDVLVHSLRASGHFHSVRSMRSGVQGDYLLQGHLYELKELTGRALAGRLWMELELRDMKTGDTVWTHGYDHNEPVSGKNVNAVVAALNRNVQRACAEFVASLDEYFVAHPPSIAPASGQ